MPLLLLAALMPGHACRHISRQEFVTICHCHLRLRSHYCAERYFAIEMQACRRHAERFFIYDATPLRAELVTPLHRWMLLRCRNMPYVADT